MKGGLRIRMCVNFGAEAARVLDAFRGDGVELELFPATCDPSRTQREHLCDGTLEAGEGFSRTVVLSGWCVPRQESLDAVHGYRFHRFDQCFHLIAPQNMVDNYLGEGAYLLTPGWLLRWRRIIHEWGFDRETARLFFQESCKRLVLLDTGVTTESRSLLREFAHFVEIPFHVVPVGLDYLRRYLENIILRWKLETNQEAWQEANRRSADYAMVYDLIADLTKVKNERRAIDDILGLFKMLFAPERLSYAPLQTSGHGEPPDFSGTGGNSRSAPLDMQDELIMLQEEKGFFLRVSHNQETLGMIRLEGVAFPQYLKHYASLATTMAKVCGLAISNARTYQAIKQTAEDLRREMEERRKAEDARKKVETELLKLQKMEAMSVLAGGIAHDFNNLLGVVVGHISMAQMDVSPQDPVSKELDAAYRGALRAGELVKQFLAVSHAATPDKRTADLKATLESAVHSARASCNAEIHPTIPGDLWQAEIDPNQIAKSLFNIIKNAGEATGPGQTIGIHAENLCVHSTDERDTPSLMSPGRYVRIRVTDEGIGIPEEHLSRIFDPYFSTKTRGAQKGMGMGLTIAYSVIRRHNGFIRVESRPGEGTSVEVYLPALPQ